MGEDPGVPTPTPMTTPTTMTTPIPAPSRRTVLRAAAAVAAIGALTPAAARAAVAEVAAAGVFGFGVASGDPTATQLLLWTRVTPSPDAVPGSGRGAATAVTWELAADEAFTRVLQSGTVTSDAARDHTLHVDVSGLAPYTRYWYRFRALGATSPVGRTQTSPDEPGVLHALRLAVASCANYTGGYYSPYRHIAARDDVDMVLFLGDYIYEYGNGSDRYGPADLAGKRDHQPPVEVLSLADYRTRHALYKTDPDLAAAHRRHPWVLIFDDHEVCDNTYDTGANNHQPATEGDFGARRRAAYQAYLEWLPVRLPDQSVPHRGTRFWRRFSLGPLADLHCLETRQNRSMQVPLTDPQAAAKIADPARHLPEPEQMAWLQAGLAAGGVRWHLVANQVVFAPVRLPSTPGTPLDAVAAQLGVSPMGQVFNTDQWDGYGADQRALVEAIATRSGADVVVLTGDIHSSWAIDLPRDAGTYAPADPLNNSVGVEFVTPSVTSDGFREIAGSEAGATALTTGFQAANRHVRYLDGIGHGYVLFDVTPERVQSDYLHVSNREDPAATQRVAASWQSLHGSRRVSPAAAPIGARSDSVRVLAGASSAAPASATATLPAAPSGRPTARPTTRPAPARRTSKHPVATQPTRTLAFTGLDERSGVAGAAGLLGLAAVLLRRRRGEEKAPDA